MTTNLLLINRWNPAERKVDANVHQAHDPEHLPIVRAVVPENDGEDNATKVTRRTSNPRDDTVLWIQLGLYCHHSRSGGEDLQQTATHEAQEQNWHRCRPRGRMPYRPSGP